MCTVSWSYSRVCCCQEVARKPHGVLAEKSALEGAAGGQRVPGATGQLGAQLDSRIAQAVPELQLDLHLRRILLPELQRVHVSLVLPKVSRALFLSPNSDVLAHAFLLRLHESTTCSHVHWSI